MNKNLVIFFEKYVGLIGCFLLTAGRKTIGILSKNDCREQPENIVFVKFIEQGALILHHRTFKEATSQYGANNIHICTFKSNAPLLDILDVIPAVNRIYIDDSSFIQFAATFVKAIFSLRKKNIDTAIDLEFFTRSTAIFCYLTGARRRAGYHRYMGLQNYRGDLFTHRLSYSHYVHVADSSWHLFKSVELAISQLPALEIPSRIAEPSPIFTPTKSDIEHLDQVMNGSGCRSTHQKIIVVNLSLNDVLPLRMWPEGKFKKFIFDFGKKYPDYNFVFTGRDDEYELTKRFIADLSLPSALNLCGKTTLRDILTLYSRSKILLCSDSGPGHLATLTQVKSVVLFGPETPILYGPLSGDYKVIYKSLPCSPCYNVYNNRRSPCTNNLCMQKISVEEVLTAVDGFV